MKTWTSTRKQMPKPLHDVFIRLADGHEPGIAVWDPRQCLWCGFTRNYRAIEVSHWRPKEKDS